MKKLIILLFVAMPLLANLSVADEAAKKEAEALLNTMGMDSMLQESIDQMIQMQLQQNPGLVPYRKIFEEFFAKHMSFESLKPDMIDIYAEAFTADELEDINDFYKTPTGTKTLQLMPELMNKGGQIGAQRVQDNMPELQAMINAENERLQQEAAAQEAEPAAE